MALLQGSLSCSWWRVLTRAWARVIPVGLSRGYPEVSCSRCFRWAKGDWLQCEMGWKHTCVCVRVCVCVCVCV